MKSGLFSGAFIRPMRDAGGGMAAMDFGDHVDMEVLLETEILCWLGNATKNQLMKNREWGGKIFFLIG